MAALVLVCLPSALAGQGNQWEAPALGPSTSAPAAWLAPPDSAQPGAEHLLSERARHELLELREQRSAIRQPMHPLLITAGAATGAALGTFIGSRFQEDCETRCINARGTLGPIVANTALIPLGAHITGLGRGEMLSSALVSAGWGAAAVVAAGLSDETWPVWAAIPGQVVSSVAIEWYTARRAARRAAAARPYRPTHGTSTFEPSQRRRGPLLLPRRHDHAESTVSATHSGREAALSLTAG